MNTECSLKERGSCYLTSISCQAYQSRYLFFFDTVALISEGFIACLHFLSLLLFLRSGLYV